ncbi:hypothetical protein EV13_3107 [Prochlorococcus sp. MIT 0702]|nr:hypothetical protein EV12_3075 [Prochlorococcus sp. MIT 0701]KGG25276.1 hypothetical protein EV13_3107 [Prochlorococcus sp. MIT 0702]
MSPSISRQKLTNTSPITCFFMPYGPASKCLKAHCSTHNRKKQGTFC